MNWLLRLCTYIGNVALAYLSEHEKKTIDGATLSLRNSTQSI